MCDLDQTTRESKAVTMADIMRARTKRGGWTRVQLAAWGVPWPPPKGWKVKLAGGRR